MLTFNQVVDNYQAFYLSLMRCSPDDVVVTSTYTLIKNPYRCLKFIYNTFVVTNVEPNQALCEQITTDLKDRLNIDVATASAYIESFVDKPNPSYFLNKQSTCYRLMWKSIDTVNELPIDDVDIQFCRISTEDELWQWVSMQVAKDTDNLINDFEMLKSVFTNDPRLHFFCGYYGERVVTASLLFINEHIAYFPWLTTDPQFRRIGLANQMLHHRMVYAQSQGATDFFILNNAFSLGCAKKRGFVPINNIALYISSLVG